MFVRAYNFNIYRKIRSFIVDVVETNISTDRKVEKLVLIIT